MGFDEVCDGIIVIRIVKLCYSSCVDTVHAFMNLRNLEVFESFYLFEALLYSLALPRSVGR